MGYNEGPATSLTIQRTVAKAEAKAAKARVKTLRPWFMKKRYWLLCFVAISSIGSALSRSESSTNTSSTSGNSNTSKTEPALATPNETTAQKNARKKAESYLNVLPFSKTGLIAQLKFNGFSESDATYAVNAITVDWNEQAAKKAKSYLGVMAFSRSGLIDQLVFNGFTRSQAEYGVSATGL
jgi:hypothetical protein